MALSLLSVNSVRRCPLDATAAPKGDYLEIDGVSYYVDATSLVRINLLLYESARVPIFVAQIPSMLHSNDR
jgi:hypothetical protein